MIYILLVTSIAATNPPPANCYETYAVFNDMEHSQIKVKSDCNEQK